MQIQSPEAKQQLIQRLRRIEGQLRGLESMLEEERDCREIMQQLSAAHSALQGASRTFFQEYAVACLSGDEGSNNQPLGRQLVSDMLALLDKAP